MACKGSGVRVPSAPLAVCAGQGLTSPPQLPADTTMSSRKEPNLEPTATLTDGRRWPSMDCHSGPAVPVDGLSEQPHAQLRSQYERGRFGASRAPSSGRV